MRKARVGALNLTMKLFRFEAARKNTLTCAKIQPSEAMLAAIPVIKLKMPFIFEALM